MAMAVRAQDDQEALEWCKKAAPDDYQWILEQCMQIRADSISQADDMVLQEKLMKRLNEIEQTLTQYPETERRKLALEQLQREAQTRKHQGLCPCHPALAAEGSGGRGDKASPPSFAEAVGRGGFKGALRPGLRSPDR
ncbi:hypothetical protein LE197_09340 [Pseudomonas sp. PS1(2021)]|uniref:hypothetical protein n=1 Tax=Pseudomonas sp. PS1(2021) TaxID=2866282 RepID=UPI001CF08DBA|nr:hypothetical protein [Pseudomonas sp. PS1(2021)]UCM30071.1 hypothetical protein LE197_09340 [Pseudomonas sp. PS1(2021)]